MDKWQLIGVALDQLISQWNFRQNDFEVDTNDATLYEYKITWLPKSLNQDGSVNPTDPMSISRAVIITFNKHNNELGCSICKVNSTGVITPETTIYATKVLVHIRKNFRKFMWLRSQILVRDKAKKNNKFFEELYKIFPRTLDEHILGKD